MLAFCVVCIKFGRSTEPNSFKRSKNGAFFVSLAHSIFFMSALLSSPLSLQTTATFKKALLILLSHHSPEKPKQNRKKIMQSCHVRRAFSRKKGVTSKQYVLFALIWQKCWTFRERSVDCASTSSYARMQLFRFVCSTTTEIFYKNHFIRCIFFPRNYSVCFFSIVSRLILSAILSLSIFMAILCHSSSHRIRNETPNIEKLKHQSKYEKKATSQQNADSFPLCLAFPYWHIVHIFSLCKYYILGDYAGQTHNLAHSHNVSGAEEMLCI